MRYNLSNIMKRAWQLVKANGETISAGLKKAWAEAKAQIKEVAMRGSERQIKWANEIKKNVAETISNALEVVKADPRLATTPAARENVQMWEDRLSKLDRCNIASDIIDFFKHVRFTGDANADFRAIQANYKVSPNNGGYEFK